MMIEAFICVKYFYLTAQIYKQQVVGNFIACKMCFKIVQKDNLIQGREILIKIMCHRNIV